MIRWKRLGLVHTVENGTGVMKSHAALPFVVPQGGDRLRVYFSARDAENRSHGASLDLDLRGETFSVARVDANPVLSPGGAGLFDDCGTTLSAHVKFKGEDLFYYTGWTLGVKAPYQTFCGLALGTDFKKYGRVPVLDRTELDPYAVGFVAVRSRGDSLEMWYESNEGWATADPKTGYRFVIRYATSTDGRVWNRHPGSCIPHRAGEYVISRPSVFVENGHYRMWYSRKEGGCYLLGFATSSDGIQWQRADDQAGLEPSGQGWDSDEIAYPYVFEHAGRKYLLYNGNSYGKSGFGLAVES